MNEKAVVIYCISCGAPVVGSLVDVGPCVGCGTRMFSTNRRVPEWILSFSDRLFLKVLRIAAE